uniref:Uncharacterized protein n=1 Tax=Rangifer tarandus platyrhynchus TaxID=3082113 RepID=A0ACB0F4U0_RANTA|nr:unnamed protein product [Rangifer tarandus platyrhynchus]
MTTPWESHEPRVFRAHRRPRVKNGWRGRERPGKQWLAQVRQAAFLGASVTSPSELCLPSSPTPRLELGCSSQLFGPELDGLSLCLLSDSLLSPTWSAQSAGVTHEEEGPQGGAGPSAKQQLRPEAGKAGASGNVGFPHGVAWMTGEEKAFLLLIEGGSGDSKAGREDNCSGAPGLLIALPWLSGLDPLQEERRRVNPRDRSPSPGQTEIRFYTTGPGNPGARPRGRRRLKLMPLADGVDPGSQQPCVKQMTLSPAGPEEASFEEGAANKPGINSCGAESGKQVRWVTRRSCMDSQPLPYNVSRDPAMRGAPDLVDERGRPAWTASWPSLRRAFLGPSFSPGPIYSGILFRTAKWTPKHFYAHRLLLG